MCAIDRRLYTMLAIVVVLALGACRSNEPSAISKAGSASQRSCTPRVVTIRAAPEDSFPLAERCRLVNLAVASVAGAAPNTGLQPADTAAITSALLVPLSQTTPDGTLIRATWHVTLSLENRPYDAEVIVDRSSGQAMATRIHKM
jgi:ABC-type Fe3+-hydroxamate transport system substrate-binding protein